MSRIQLTDQQWAFIQPLLPPPAHTGRPRADNRRTIEGILYVLITGCRWQDLPREYGAPTTVWRRLKRWGEEGVWVRHLACRPRPAGQTRLVHGVPRRFVRTREEGRRPGRPHQEGEGHQV